MTAQRHDQETRLNPTMNGDMLDLAALTPDPQNARRHTRRNLALIESALHEVGAARSIVIDETGTILAGNATVQAAKAAGLAGVRIIETDGSELVAVRRSGLTEAQKRRLALFDNRAAELAEWDAEVLASLAEETDLAALWEPDELADLLGRDDALETALAEPDAVPDLPADPISRLGDVWRLGSHRLLCGDATDPDALARLMGAERASCLWTDPPYGVGYTGKTKDALTLANDDAAGLDGLLRFAFAAAQTVLLPGSAFYVAHPAGPLALLFQQVLADLGWKTRQSLVWVKDALVLGHADYHYRHEPILYGFLPGGAGRLGRGSSGWHGDDAQTTVFEVPKPSRSAEHPTMKPVALVAAMLSNSTAKDDLVLDPFAGSGSTLVACQELGRRARLVELDPRYTDVIVQRWEQATGDSAERLSAEPAA